VLTIDTSPAAAQLGLAASKGQLHRRKREQRWTRWDFTHWNRLASSARQWWAV